MCTEDITVINLNNQRDAYEIESYLKGISGVQDASADFLTDTVSVQYDESRMCHDDVLSHLQDAGCTPDERVNGLMDTIKARWMGQKV